MRKLKIGFLLLLISQNLLAYSFICNSIDASGHEGFDTCGECDDATGPRWLPTDINIKVDTKNLPNNIQKEEWVRAVKNGMKAWNDVPGANLNLEFQDANGRPSRTFGANGRKHEIFWITDRQEWRKKVGAGEHGALGVTTAPYFCQGSNRDHREIYDADLVMNGVSKKFKWQEVCNFESEDSSYKPCHSMTSTLSHELGHFVGLGHPCALCSDALMSAQSGYNLEGPVFDDQEALRVLYSGEKSGEVGAACDLSDDESCDADFTCVKHDNASYCAKPCEGECATGFKCDAGFCKFATGRLADAAAVGENCSSRPCDEELTCAGVSEGQYHCFERCELKKHEKTCEEPNTCYPLSSGSKGICVQTSGLGEACDAKILCGENLGCVADTCHRTCNPKARNKDKYCGAGEFCRAVNAHGIKGVCVDKSQPKLLFSTHENHKLNISKPAIQCDCQSVTGSDRSTKSYAFMAFMLILLFALRFLAKKR